MLNCFAESSDSTSILEALPDKLNIKRHERLSVYESSHEILILIKCAVRAFTALTQVDQCLFLKLKTKDGL